jgi:chromosome segregation ATPase
MSSELTNLERLVRVETKIESLSNDIGEVKDSIKRMEASLNKQIEKQDQRQWDLWAKIAGLSGVVTLVIQLLLKGI